MLYSVVSPATAFTTAHDLFEIVAASDCVVVLHSLEIGQTTELGDAQEEQVTVSIIRAHSTSGSGGATPTAVPLEAGQAAAGSTLERNNTTPATGGSPVTVAQKPWNLRTPFLWLPPPEHRIIVSPGVRCVVTLPAPADSVTAFAELVFEEIGG